MIVNLKELNHIFFGLEKRDYWISDEFIGIQVHINKQTSRGFKKWQSI